jgi:hypothetical protein
MKMRGLGGGDLRCLASTYAGYSLQRAAGGHWMFQMVLYMGKHLWVVLNLGWAKNPSWAVFFGWFHFILGPTEMDEFRSNSGHSI